MSGNVLNYFFSQIHWTELYGLNMTRREICPGRGEWYGKHTLDRKMIEENEGHKENNY